MTTYVFPWPTSKNKQYANSHNGSGRGRYPTKGAKEYAASVAAVAMTTRMEHSPSGPLWITFMFSPPKINRKRDSHNGFPILFDAMKKAGIIEDDCDKVLSGGCAWTFAPPSEHGSVTVEVFDWDDMRGARC